MRVHVHTNEPQAFLDAAAALGTLERTKVDDMILQQLGGLATASIALVTDSTCDLPESVAHYLGIVPVPLVVTLDGHTYRDGVDMTPLEFYRRMRDAVDLPKSSQPAVTDFTATYERLLEHHEGIVSVHIAGALVRDDPGGIDGRPRGRSVGLPHPRRRLVQGLDRDRPGRRGGRRGDPLRRHAGRGRGRHARRARPGTRVRDRHRRSSTRCAAGA